MAKPLRQPLVDRLAVGVARGLSVTAAARAAGVPGRTAREWAQTPEFKLTVKRLRDDIVKQAVGVLSRLSVKAAKRLGRLVDSADEDVSLKACNALLDKMLAVRDHTDVSERLLALEARHDAQGHRPANRGFGA